MPLRCSALSLLPGDVAGGKNPTLFSSRLRSHSSGAETGGHFGALMGNAIMASGCFRFCCSPSGDEVLREHNQQQRLVSALWCFLPENHNSANTGGSSGGAHTRSCILKSGPVSVLAAPLVRKEPTQVPQGEPTASWSRRGSVCLQPSTLTSGHRWVGDVLWPG